MIDDELRKAAFPLVERLGFPADFSLRFLKGGKNNRVCELSAPESGSILLKQYFKHPGDRRDRCSTEFSFLQYADAQGIQCVPKPLYCDAEQGLALYSFVDGQAVSVSDVDKPALEQTVQFFLALNSSRFGDAARSLPVASEACFSIAAHMEVVAGRVERLLAASQSETFSRSGAEFVQLSLNPAWDKAKLETERLCRRFGLDKFEAIALSQRILSPSDFGFHNALKSRDGRFYFLDFEYAGWDDVAKTICDFFLQPAVPVANAYRPDFVAPLLGLLQEPQKEEQRINALSPLYKIKWCTICLNDFLPVAKERRGFSLGAEKKEEIERQENQLRLAASILERDSAFCQSYAFFPN